MTSMLAHVENPSARITVQMTPQASPGHCGICGVSECQDGFVDPRLDFEFYGSLIFCSNCTAVIAAVFGFISPEDYQDIVAELQYYQLKLREAEIQIKEQDKIIDGFSSRWLNRDSTPLYNPGLSVEDETVETSTDDGSEVTPSTGVTESELSGGSESEQRKILSIKSGTPAIFSRTIDLTEGNESNIFKPPSL